MKKYKRKNFKESKGTNNPEENRMNVRPSNTFFSPAVLSL
jgi:hypothetical protein